MDDLLTIIKIQNSKKTKNKFQCRQSNSA